jgi:uncharacterized YigZ family protein
MDIPCTMTDEYKTLRGEVRTETKVQNSRFIATALSTVTTDEVEQFIAETRKHFHDATHKCYAYRIGTDGTQYRSNDDGEPGGSGGRPILAAIDRFGLTDVTVIVTRYFGGTKLGVRILSRAYGDSAENALAQAEHVVRYKMEVLETSFPHSQISNVMHIVSKLGARILDTTYDEEVHVRLEARSSKLGHLRSSLLNQTSGNISIK